MCFQETSGGLDRVRSLRAPAIGVTTSIGHHIVPSSTFSFSVSTWSIILVSWTNVETIFLNYLETPKGFIYYVFLNVIYSNYY